MTSLLLPFIRSAQRPVWNSLSFTLVPPVLYNHLKLKTDHDIGFYQKNTVTYNTAFARQKKLLLKKENILKAKFKKHLETSQKLSGDEANEAIMAEQKAVPSVKQLTETDIKTAKNQSFKEKIDKTVSPVPTITETADNSHRGKVDGLKYVRLCAVTDPQGQLHTNNEVSDDHSKYRHFIEDLSLKSLPSVTTIINKTMSKDAWYFLNRWKKMKIEELGEEGFKQYQKKTFELGGNLHTCIDKYLSGTSKENLPLSSENEGHWQSLEKVFPDISDVKATEVEVSHRTLFYHGKFDCVARYRDMLCVIDWKTSQKAKPYLSNTYDNPMQLAAYLGAINSSKVLNLGEEETKLTHCALVIAYPQGDPAHVHVLDKSVVKKYWDLWLDRLELYWVMKSNERVKKLNISASL